MVGISVCALYHDGLGTKVVSLSNYLTFWGKRNKVQLRRPPRKSLQQKNEVIFDPSTVHTGPTKLLATNVNWTLDTRIPLLEGGVEVKVNGKVCQKGAFGLYGGNFGGKMLGEDHLTSEKFRSL